MQEAIEEAIGLPIAQNTFIEANTKEIELLEMNEKHVIPVFTKFNEPLISHSDFIEVVGEVAQEIFARDLILEPSVRVSHPVQGRIPEARNKPAKELLEHEKTLYYERMAFTIEIPTIYDTIEGSRLSLTVGGVKAYNLDNYNSSRKDQHFKIFIGFKNSVCTNLCIATDGFKSDLVVKDVHELKRQVQALISNYDANVGLEALKTLAPAKFSEEEVAYLVGRLKMYPYLKPEHQSLISRLNVTESQLNTMLSGHFEDNHFRRNSDGGTNLWRLYNNVTGAIKSSYIDTYFDKCANALSFMQELGRAKLGEQNNAYWYLEQ